MQFWSLPGLTSYETARQFQLKLVERRAQDLIPDTVLFLEHEPVITQGRGLQFTGTPKPRHMPLPGALPPGMSFAESERGGDLTYHGPGQLVVYPIFKLDGQGFAPHRDIAGFLRRFEQVFIEAISRLTQGRAVGFARESATGVWVRAAVRSDDPGCGAAAEADSRKIASIGIAIRRWVTYHGLAINCVNDLKPFHLISPCGFSPEVMTRLSDWLAPGSADFARLQDWELQGRRWVEECITEGLGGKTSDILSISAHDSESSLVSERNDAIEVSHRADQA